MTSDMLRRAREYEQTHIPAVKAKDLPCYHLTGIVGWINDPNGFSRYGEDYHLFFQYNPYATVWDAMHWAHVKTRDFLHWERLPAALAPDMPYDGKGCFSGSALELPDGRHMLMYTAVRLEQQPDGTEREFQTQCLALGDGIDYEKYPGNPVIDAGLLPPGGSARDFRDPKIFPWKGGYAAVMGNRCPDGSGAILFYQSADGFRWRYAGTLAASANRYGRMWECPDFFSLDGQDVLLVSPQEMRSLGPEFIDGNTTLCLIGRLDEERCVLCPEHEQTIDYGLDFYAPQTVETADGRRVMIAWMQYWNSVDYRPRPELPFFGQMTVPRELAVRDGRLIQNPVRELEECRRGGVEYKNLRLGGKRTVLPGVSGRILDLTVTIRPGSEGAPFCSFTMAAAVGEDRETRIRYDREAGTVSVDRSRSGMPEKILNRREFAVRNRGGELQLRLLLDRYSLELFVNDGEQAASFGVFTPETADGIWFEADGSALLDVEKYRLEF